MHYIFLVAIWNTTKTRSERVGMKEGLGASACRQASTFVFRNIVYKLSTDQF